jgi:hypothetical protein
MGGTIQIRQGRWMVIIIYRLDKRSRMNREIHVRICGSVGVKFPCATQLTTLRTLKRHIIFDIVPKLTQSRT